MYHNIALNTNLFTLLLQIDVDMLTEVKSNVALVAVSCTELLIQEAQWGSKLIYVIILSRG